MYIYIYLRSVSYDSSPKLWNSRTRPGVCFRIFTQDALSDGTLPSSPVPEAARSALAPAVLVLLSLGVRRVLKFDWPTAPPSILVADALQELVALGALDRETGKTV